MTFVVVGGGPTGVELAGAIAELANQTLKQDFRNIDTSTAKVLLIEGLDRVLPPFAPELSAQAKTSLERLGVTVLTQRMVTQIDDISVTIRNGEEIELIPTRTALWAAGVKASPLGAVLAERTAVPLDRSGRVMVKPDFSIEGYPDIFVVGDLACYLPAGAERPLPGVAPVAMQQGNYVARLIRDRLKGQTTPAFRYSDKGSMAVIGQNAAVVDLNFIKFAGPLAWFVWIFAHIYYLIEFDNKLVVMVQWAWNYFTRNRGARIITGLEGNPVQSRAAVAAIAQDSTQV